MNIYIKPEVEELLRRYDGSMSGLVNRLLRDFFTGNPSAATGLRRELDKVEELKKAYPKIIGTPSGSGTVQLSPRRVDQCEHGAGARLCVIKGCKNYQFRKG